MDTAHATVSRSKLSRSLLLALALGLLLVLWMLSGRIDSTATSAPESRPPSPTSLPQVQTRISQAQAFQPTLILQGQLEPIKHLQVRSQISAQIAELNLQQGAKVEPGQLILRFDAESRPTQLQRAEAELRLREAELRAGERLKQNQHVSETDLLRLRLALSNAQAELELARQQLAYTEIRASFAGVLNQLPVEVGELRQPGDLLAELIDISQLKLTAQIPQQQAAHVSKGLAVEAILLNGERLPGEVHYLSRLADPATRSFQLEARIDNRELRPIAGGTARIEILLPIRSAHFLSPALLALNDQGQIGIRLVNVQHQVEFLPVELLSLGTEGAWIAGAPDQIELITLGAGFVQDGQSVQVTRMETAE